MAERVEIIRRLFVLYPAGATVERIEGYAELLGEFSPEDVAQACEGVAQFWTSTFVPPPGVLIERARDCRKARLQRERVRRGAPPEAGKPTAWSLAWTRLRKLHGRFPTDAEVEEALSDE
jgi:hypothetical protein